MSSRSGPLGERFPRGLRVALGGSVVLHLVAIAAMAINRAKEIDLSPPPVFGSFVSPSALAAIEGAGAKPVAPVRPSASEAAAKPVEAPKPPPEPPKPPAPAKPPAPSPEAIPIPDQAAPKPEKPRREPSKSETPKPEKSKPEPPRPEKPKPEAQKSEKSKPDEKTAKDKPEKPPAKPEQVAKADKPADTSPVRPTKADEESMEARLRELAKKAEKAGIETGATWGIEGGTGKVPTDACQAALSQYGAEVIKKLRASVSYPDQLRGFSARIMLEIAKDGALVNGAIATSSGNRLFDDSVLAGVKKAAPFGPLPACWTDASFKGAIDFVAEGGTAG